MDPRHIRNISEDYSKSDNESNQDIYQEYYDNSFFEQFKKCDESQIEFVIGRNRDFTKFLVTKLGGFKNDVILDEYIFVYEVNGLLPENVNYKVGRLKARHELIKALIIENPNVPVRMNPYAPTDFESFRTLIKCMFLTYSYFKTTSTAYFLSNKLFMINYVDNEIPNFIYRNHLVYVDAELEKLEMFEGCEGCDGKSEYDGCKEVEAWFQETFKDIIPIHPITMATPFFECSFKCKCFKIGKPCKNRISQRNRLNIPLIIFRTHNKGWALCAGRDMEEGEMVTEYIGVVKEEEDIYADDSSYMFEMDYQRPKIEEMYGDKFKKNGYYNIDSKQIGNESRFANHSCDPNMEIFVSFGIYKSPNFHRVFYRTCKNVSVGQELTVDYFHNVDFYVNVDFEDCFCGNSKCYKKIPRMRK
uniref:SET domain-containing protein n=1 Tax=Parastrongyloides trichosuri TaxID=131310 RepID=A0A0N4ZU20_PARTI